DRRRVALVCEGNVGTTTQQDRRWWALIVLCMGNLMIVLDTTIVNVALPSIRTDLGFTESSLAWVVNAYLLTFGGCLLLGGLLGGVLTDTLDWHWIFLVNLPVGIAVFVACLNLVPADRSEQRTGRLDVAGAVTVTSALMVAVYAIVNGNRVGWVTIQTLGL